MLGHIINRMALIGAVLTLWLGTTALVPAHAQQASHSTSHSVMSGTLMLGGSITSTAHIAMKGAFSVGHASNLTWNLPRFTSVTMSGYTEQIDDLAYRFDIAPDSSTDMEVDGQPVRQFTWAAPPANTVIHVTVSMRTIVHSDLAPFHSTAGYPIGTEGGDAARYLTVSPQVQLPASAKPLLASFAAGKTSEEAVVDAVVNWVAAHVRYDSRTAGSISAASVLKGRRTICEGYVNLTTGMLRALGIPARAEYGWISANQLSLPGPDHGSSYIRWSVPGTAGELHTWLSVYFPNSGWVPIDPQREKFFVDPHHIAFFPAMEAGNVQLGAWTADYQGNESPTGGQLPNSDIEIVPGADAASTVTLQSSDTVHATFHQLKHDVKGVLLFSR
ncbi:MAG TPA: transglutaminase-like domain-containing protein [Chloroflexota bacterium]